MSEKYQCSRCKSWVEDKDSDVYHFKSVHNPHTLLSIQMCLKCRDAVFDFIEGAEAKQVNRLRKRLTEMSALFPDPNEYDLQQMIEQALTEV